MAAGSGLIILVIVTTVPITWGIAWLYFSGRYKKFTSEKVVQKLQRVEESEITLAIMELVCSSYMTMLAEKLGISDDERFKFEVPLHQYRGTKLEYTYFELWKNFANPIFSKKMQFKIDYSYLMNPVFTVYSDDIPNGGWIYVLSTLDQLTSDIKEVIDKWK